MTSVSEIFETLGDTFFPDWVRLGDIIASKYPGRELIWIREFKSDSRELDGRYSYRLIHRPEPQLPTETGSILTNGGGIPHVVLTKSNGWFDIFTGTYLVTEELQAKYGSGELITLIDAKDI